jgi:hypothetical protein
MTAALTSKPVDAAVIISNLNNSSNATDINNGTPGDPNQNWDASSFHVDSNNYSLSDIVVQVALDPSSTSSNFQLQLRADTPSGPGAVIVTLTPSQPVTSSIADITFTPQSAVTLQANTTYWVTADVTQGSVLWRVSSDFSTTGPATLGNPAFAFSADNGVTWTTVPEFQPDKFQVDGEIGGSTVVPEPPAIVIWMLALTATALVATRRVSAAVSLT